MAKFYVVDRHALPPSSGTYPCFVLEKDDWDDFQYKTMFTLKFYKTKKNPEIIGDIKILSRSNALTPERTPMPRRFTSLNDNYCSVGQTKGYYDYFDRLKDKTLAREVLWALKDAGINTHIYSKFKDFEGFRKSLIRFSEARSALYYCSILFNPESLPTTRRTYYHNDRYSLIDKEEFTFITALPGADRPHNITFNFDDNPLIPKRINILIGRNGTGKTQYLIRLANALSGWKPDDGIFGEDRPYFTKIFAISYSPFEDFAKPDTKKSDSRTFSYRYCGIRDGDDQINIDGLLTKLSENLYEISKGDRLELFRRYAPMLLGDSIDIRDTPETNFQKLSSGQRVLFFILSDIVRYIQRLSLIIFDEPENHLHPNVLSQLMLCLRELLEEYGSYSIIATHSPLILQDVPSECVRVLKRVDKTTYVENLQIESFAENLSTLTEEVFEISSVQSTWSEVLKNLSVKVTYEEALQYFKGLSLNGKMYLKSLYKQEEK